MRAHAREVTPRLQDGRAQRHQPHGHETLPLGNIKLEVGAVTETVSVVAQSATVQTASSERSGTIVTSQVENRASRGRNVVSPAKLLPGLVMTSESDQMDITNNIRGFEL